MDFFLFKVALEILGLGNTLIRIKGNFVLNVLIICSMSPRAQAGVDCAMSPRACTFCDGWARITWAERAQARLNIYVKRPKFVCVDSQWSFSPHSQF